MTDVINKIKIKKQDGTFTDYIPIGAEAKNVKTQDGESVENKLKIINTDTAFYEDITYSQERYNDTDCYFTTIPKYDSDGDEILLYIGETEEGSSPTEFARKNYTTLTTNATLRMNGTVEVGSVISNGEIIRDIDTSSI